MNALRLAGAVAFAAAISLAGCRSKPEPLPAATAAAQAPADTLASAVAVAVEPAPAAPIPEPSVIRPDAAGFWPATESRSPAIRLSLFVGNQDSLRSWKVEIVPAPGSRAPGGPGPAVRAFSGTAEDLPETLAWDGLASDGALAPEGLYSATLSAEYSGGLPAQSLASRSFALSLSPPEPVLIANPPRAKLETGGFSEPIAFELDASAALAPIDTWRLDLIGPDGLLLRYFEGAWPAAGAPAPIAWDGRAGSETGDFAGETADSKPLAQPGARYSAILSLRDAYGHTASAQASVSVEELPFAPERSSVQPWTSGFSPNGDRVMDSMDFNLGFGQRAALRTWRLEISRAGGAPSRSFRGAAPDLPASLSWDGLDSGGAPAPEGRYFATLFIDYGSSFSPAVARSPPFLLDVAAPALTLSSSPELFAPDQSGGEAATLSIVLGAQEEPAGPLARMADWSVEILDPGDRVFARFGGPWPPRAISWDGLGADGTLVESAENYRLVARARDEFGNSSQAAGSVQTDILVIKEGDRYRVDVASIVFRGYTDDYEGLPAPQAAQNRLTLDRLAAKFSRFPGYRIRLVGHAVMINWDDPDLGRGEQERVLIPLSRSRAAAIAKALASRGIEASRMTVEGVGATRPVVPDSDLVNRWKNRRVEFYLEK
jgi:hypothetical protein